jgi:hypothetical protein
MNDYLAYFFKPSHFFSLRPEPLHSRAIIILVIIFGLVILISVVSKLITIKTKDALKAKGYKKLYHLCLTMGIIGLVYLFFAWQGAALLAARFWLAIWALTLIIWLIFIWKYLIKEVPNKRKEIDQKRQFQKYIP